jgi:hypothetical protein
MDARPGRNDPRIVKVDAFVRGPDLPADALRAMQMGFSRSDNPHPRGSRQYWRWDNVFQSTDSSHLRFFID